VCGGPAGNLAAQTNETTFTAATPRANVTAAAVGAKIARITTAAVFRMRCRVTG
jgi:hypothetical protein